MAKDWLAKTLSVKQLRYPMILQNINSKFHFKQISFHKSQSSSHLVEPWTGAAPFPLANPRRKILMSEPAVHHDDPDIDGLGGEICQKKNFGKNP
jgi:hypothetical protein